MWAFLLWKNTQNKAKPITPGKLPDKDNSWIMYQKWCKLDAQDRETWVTAGRNVQTFTKISTAKMQQNFQVQVILFSIKLIINCEKESYHFYFPEKNENRRYNFGGRRNS